MKNPFFEEWNTKYQSVPFEDIKQSHFLPAVEKGFAIAKERINKLKNNVDEPNFENTIAALSSAPEDLFLCSGVFFNLLSAESDNEFKSLAEKISPILSEYKSYVSMDSTLFNRVKHVYQNMGRESLTNEQKRLVEQEYTSFIRNGALLDETDKKKLFEIDKELSLLSPKFSQNLLNATNAFYYHTTHRDEVSGIPKNDLKSAEFRAKQKGFDSGWLFNLQSPSLVSVLTYAENRELRKKMFLASVKRAYKDEYDNCELILKQAKLRYERAKLLGYKTHADYVLEERMAESSDTVNSFLERIYQVSYPVAKEEVKKLKEYARELDGLEELMPWDLSYYSERQKKDRFGYDEEELKPYFQVENCINGVFKVAEKLYGLSFVRNKEISVYHEDVEVYEVMEGEKYIGLLYIDLYPRETKRGGAWMTTFLSQGLYKGSVRRPHVCIVGNLTPPNDDGPALLRFREVQTIFHEFGHALHALLSDCTYSDLASPNVYWDFVELPSQIFENWILEKEALELFASHYKTNETIPDELVLKIKKVKNHNKGIANVRQLIYGMLDMGWHDTDPGDIINVKDHEDKVIEKLRLLPKVDSGCSSTSFSHVFSGGYSAGYYSYKWAEVLDADAFEKFLEEGIFNKETAESFRRNILSKGNSAHPMELYLSFRGRRPDPDAMLRRDGLLKTES